MSEMRKVFHRPVQRKEAATWLLTFHQGSQSVASYVIEFRFLGVESGWNKVAIQGAFVRGLSEEIKDTLAARVETDSLDALMSLSVRLDNHLRERRREKAGRLKRFSPNSQSPELATASLTKQPVPEPVFLPSPSGVLDTAGQSSPDSSRTVQLLSEAKREGSPVNQGVLVGQTSSKNPSPPLHVQLPAFLLWSQQTLPLPTLVDSGAGDNFIDSDLVLQADILTEKINPPKDVKALGGKLLAHITHRTAPHTQSSVIPSHNYRIVLGLPWLKLHNPHIDCAACLSPVDPHPTLQWISLLDCLLLTVTPPYSPLSTVSQKLCTLYLYLNYLQPQNRWTSWFFMSSGFMEYFRT